MIGVTYTSSPIFIFNLKLKENASNVDQYFNKV